MNFDEKQKLKEELIKLGFKEMDYDEVHKTIFEHKSYMYNDVPVDLEIQINYLNVKFTWWKPKNGVDYVDYMIPSDIICRFKGETKFIIDTILEHLKWQYFIPNV